MSSLDPTLRPPRPAAASTAFPLRVRVLLSQLQSLVAEELTRELARLLETIERDLYLQASQARGAAAQTEWLTAVEALRANRDGLLADFSADVSAAVANLQAPSGAHSEPEGAATADSLRLVKHTEIAEINALTAISRRHEARARLPMLLLCHRMAVLGGRPAFAAPDLPVGPRAVGTMVARVAASISGEVETRLHLYKLFDRQMMTGYPSLVEAMNTLLDNANVLPGLEFVPTRVRRDNGARRAGPPAPESAPEPTLEEAARPAAPHAKNDPDRTTDTGNPSSGAFQQVSGRFDEDRSHRHQPTFGTVDTASEMQALAELQELLVAARPGVALGSAATTDILATDELDASLGELQSAEGATAPCNPAQVRHELLEHHRQARGRVAHLAAHDEETFELFGLLYSEIGRQLRQGSRAAAQLERLQVPLLRVALQDRGFFVRKQHPARQLLESIAEAGSQWLEDSESASDARLDDLLHETVSHVVDHYDGEAEVFAAAQETLAAQLEALERKAEAAQRRQVEAARGRDKLERAKQQAATAIKDAIGDAAVPRFLATLLEQAWTDVLSLVLLRHGEDSPEWRDHVEATSRIIAANRGEPAPEALQPRVTEALGLVGYQGDEAGAIAGRLLAADDNADDPASRTELALKLKARARLGANEIPPLPALEPRSAREEECFGHLRSVAFGTTIEFTINRNGDSVRQRLAWFSPTTGRVLLLNHRGQRIEDQRGRETLDQIARLISSGEARIVPADDHSSLVDRAWQSALARLRSFGRSSSNNGVTK